MLGKQAKILDRATWRICSPSPIAAAIYSATG
jgi:hypothetical protein